MTHHHEILQEVQYSGHTKEGSTCVGFKYMPNEIHTCSKPKYILKSAYCQVLVVSFQACNMFVIKAFLYDSVDYFTLRLRDQL